MMTSPRGENREFQSAPGRTSGAGRVGMQSRCKKGFRSEQKSRIRQLAFGERSPGTSPDNPPGRVKWVVPDRQSGVSTRGRLSRLNSGCNKKIQFLSEFFAQSP